jgi:hypothetical protein
MEEDEDGGRRRWRKTKMEEDEDGGRSGNGAASASTRVFAYFRLMCTTLISAMLHETNVHNATCNTFSSNVHDLNRGARCAYVMCMTLRVMCSLVMCTT